MEENMKEKDQKQGLAAGKLSVEALKTVGGGRGDLVWKSNGEYDAYLYCPYCYYREYLGSGSQEDGIYDEVTGVFECPNCKYRRNFKLVDGPNSVYLSTYI